MLGGIWQISNESFVGSMFGALWKSIEIILSDEMVRAVLLVLAAMLVVGAWILVARGLIGRRLAQFNAEFDAKEAERKAREDQEPPKG